MQAASFNIPGVMSKTYDYYADGQLRFSSDLLDHKFDRSYSHDHLGRLKQAFSGAEARGEAATNDRPYKQTFTYDGFSHLTNRTSNNWNDFYSMPQDSYTNDRRDGWTYDAEGNLFASVDVTYSYDAAGDIRTVGTYEPQSTTTRGLDGDGQQLKTVESTFKESSQTWETTTTCYLHSTVLGGQVLTELAADGAKTRTFVYAGGTVLAWQKFFGPYQAVEWEHRDASNASFRTTMINGDSWDAAELDPIGADAGTHAPLISPNPPDENSGSLTPYPSFMDSQSGLTRTYRQDGIAVSVDYFMRALEFRFHGSSLEMAEFFSKASAPRLRNYEVARYHGRQIRDFGLNENGAIAEALESKGTLIQNWLVNDVSSFALVNFMPTSEPQNTGIKAPLNTKDAKLYEQERMGALGRLAFSPNCRKFLADHGIDVKALIGAVRNQNPFDGPKSTITRLAAGVVTMSNPIDVAMGSLPIKADFNPRGGTSAETGVFPGGILGGTVLDRSDVYFRRSGISTATILHEALHSFLGETDSEIQQRFGLSTAGLSNNITEELRKHDCAE